REPVLTRISRVTPKYLSVAAAAQELGDSEFDFLLFFDESETLKVIYRRKDGTYGLLEPNL
ncbi:MAG TPA: sigma 54 modulation/S30EA ribosomal C-terminal domain-containing protein, partial [Elusimicrobiota bacterium]|nr:sigma 54 modulation/S30EA ribosomal C-terminal domain-containing protein [Elusimicrobiota bacterium]